MEMGEGRRVAAKRMDRVGRERARGTGASRRIQAVDKGEKFWIQESGVQNVNFFGGELFALFTPMFSYILQKDDL